MEWVVTTGMTLEEAKDLALDQLGVDEADAEFEVLDEPKPGLFGRMRGEARVRARVRPTQARPKVERRRRKSAGRAEAVVETAAAAGTVGERGARAHGRPPRASGGSAVLDSTGRAEGRGPTMTEQSSAEDLPSVQDAATSFLTGLTASFGVDARVSVVETEGDDELEARIEGRDLGVLIGPAGQTLQAVQELTRLAVQQARGGVRGGWLRVDVAGYRVKRREALERFTTQVVQQVVESGQPKSLEPMSSADRKIVHDAATRLGGVATSSEGEEPRRRVVIRPA